MFFHKKLKEEKFELALLDVWMPKKNGLEVLAALRKSSKRPKVIVMTSDDIPEYDVLYVGQQQEDELHCYVFDVAPKKFEPKKLYFQGRIWVDDHDFQIVETYGKTVPDIKKKKGNENLFPKFTTWREQIDGQYWFPTYTRAEDTLQFSSGGIKIREIIKYTNYRRFGAKSKIIYDGQEVKKAPPKPGEDDSNSSEPQKPADQTPPAPPPQKPQ